MGLLLQGLTASHDQMIDLTANTEQNSSHFFKMIDATVTLEHTRIQLAISLAICHGYGEYACRIKD